MFVDRAEDWKLFSEKDKFPAKVNEFYIRPVLIHELGHVIGLEHVDGRASIMVRLSIFAGNSKRNRSVSVWQGKDSKWRWEKGADKVKSS